MSEERRTGSVDGITDKSWVLSGGQAFVRRRVTRELSKVLAAYYVGDATQEDVRRVLTGMGCSE